MSVEESDTRLAAELAAYEARLVPGVTVRGGPAARATVTRRRRWNTAALAAAVVLLVVAGVGLLRPEQQEEDRLVPVTPPSATASSGEPSPPPGPLDNATIDFSRLPEADCGGPTVQLRDGDNSNVRRLDTVFSYYVSDHRPVVADLDGDGRDDYVAVLGCVGEGGGVGRSWLLMLTGDLPRLTVAGPGFPLQAVDRERDPDPELVGLRVEDGVVVADLSTDGQESTVRLRWNGTELAPARTN
ncbi:hypothetical protein [Cryptosporangium minutisporangium]|uniref:VCBS repeat-containing protein n=1 Tax=Cryptosporangium minutisporangium TaxID=113569 RepID=A0ABP6T5S5_9ACTN